MKSRLVVAALAFGTLVVGALVLGIARANSRLRELERQRRERLERLGRLDSAAATRNSPTRSVSPAGSPRSSRPAG